MKRKQFGPFLSIFAFFVLAIIACFCGTPASGAPTASEAKEAQAPMSFDAPPTVGTKATCPVMKESFVVGEQTLRSEHKGKHVAFCCPSCKAKFDANPEQYLK